MTQKQIIYYAGLALLVAVMLGWHYRQHRFKQRIRRQMAERGDMPGAKPRMRASQRWMMVFCLILAGLMFWFVPKLREMYGRRGVVVAFVLLWLVLTIAFIVVQGLTRDRAIVQARRVARGGDVERALTILRNALDAQPSAERAAALGAILAQNDRHAEAAEMFARAETLDPAQLSYSVARAVAMGKSGQAEAALAHIAGFRAKWPQDGGLALASAVLLAELGRIDEAREQFRQADELLRAFHDQQRVDWMTNGSMRQVLLQRLGGDAGARAFQVSPPTSRA